MIYTAGIRHSSIASARTVEIDGTLAQAKRAATREFGGEHLDYTIVICDERGRAISARRVGEKRWTDADRVPAASS